MPGSNGASCTSAVVIAGSATMGGFEAGALSVLARERVPVCSILGTSSGALNGIGYAAAIREQRELAMAELLCELWAEKASLCNLLRTSFDLKGAAHGFGLFNATLFLRLMRHHIKPLVHPAKCVRFACVLAPLQGSPVRVDGAPHRTFEHIAVFEDHAFASADELERMFISVAASAAVPGLFVPVDVPGLGPSIDGGAVNLAPIGYIRDGVERVYVISAHPPGWRPELKGWLHYLVSLFRILIVERIVRDLRAADGHGVDIVEIRPASDLDGSTASALVSRSLRRSYVEAGIRAAELAILGSPPW